MKIGDVFDRLTVLELLPGSMATVLCECGELRHVRRCHLTSGHTRSCRCLLREKISEQFKTHGHSRRGPLRAEYTAWCNAKTRCTNPNWTDWNNYGGRGIEMAPVFADNFMAFLAEVGPKPDPSLSLDRIDNERGYEPGNLRWATSSEQRANQRPAMVAAV